MVSSGEVYFGKYRSKCCLFFCFLFISPKMNSQGINLKTKHQTEPLVVPCRKRIRDKVDALPEMQKLKEDPSLCERSAHPPRTACDEMDSSMASEEEESPAPEAEVEADIEAVPEHPRHTVSDSFHSLPAKQSPSREQQIRHRSPHRQRSSIQPPTSHMSGLESASHHESESPAPNHCKQEWDKVFG